MGIRLSCQGTRRLGGVVASVLERFAREAGLATEDAAEVARQVRRKVARAGSEPRVDLACEERDGRVDVVVTSAPPSAP